MSDRLISPEDDETRKLLILNIVGHPEQLITFRELDYFMTDDDVDTIRSTLDELIEDNIVERVRLPDEKRDPYRPYVFYGLTESAFEQAQAEGVFKGRAVLQHCSAQTITDPIQKYVDAERPDYEHAIEFEGLDEELVTEKDISDDYKSLTPTEHVDTPAHDERALGDD